MWMLALHSEYARNVAASHPLHSPWSGLPAPTLVPEFSFPHSSQNSPLKVMSYDCPAPNSPEEPNFTRSQRLFSSVQCPADMHRPAPSQLISSLSLPHSTPPHWFPSQAGSHKRAFTGTPSAWNSSRDAAWTTPHIFQVFAWRWSLTLTTLFRIAARLLPVTPNPCPALYLFP